MEVHTINPIQRTVSDKNSLVTSHSHTIIYIFTLVFNKPNTTTISLLNISLSLQQENINEFVQGF